MRKDFIYSPAYQRRFAVACIVFGWIGVDTVDNHAVRLLIIEHGAYIILCQFRIEFGSSGTETPAVPCPEAYKVANCMAWNDSLVQQATTVGAPVGDKSGYGFYGDAVIFGFHVGTQYLRQVSLPTFGIGLQCFFGIVEQIGKIL